MDITQIKFDVILTFKVFFVSLCEIEALVDIFILL